MNLYHNFLNQVQKPSRYAGGEAQSSLADFKTFNIALCFPDVAEVAFSNWGLHVLYASLKNTQTLDCERVFAVWPDMEAQLRLRHLALGSLESGRPLGQFPLVAFSVPYELMATNILSMLDLGGIPQLAKDRTNDNPIVIAGGHAINNPEPLSMFLDAVCIGEGEEMLPQIGLVLREMGKATRQEKLHSISQIPGVYIPSFYEEERNSSDEFLGLSPVAGAPSMVHRRFVTDLEKAVYPSSLPIPHCIPIHDRAAVEIMRGCPRRCRFCAAGNIITPVRMRTPQQVVQITRNLIKGTGYPEVSLLSLNSPDYPHLPEVIALLWEELASKRISISLPSLSVRGFSRQLADVTQKLRGTQLTFAPEAGSARMRAVIGKGITETQVLTATQNAYAAGAESLKLYFMCGLPEEEDDDLVAIGSLVRKILALGNSKTSATINLSVLIPKAHTPFQWAAQPDEVQMLRKLQMVKDNLPRRATIKPITPIIHRLEAALSRGSRKGGEAILAAYRLGCRFDGWRDQFRPALWQQAYQQVGLDLDMEAGRSRCLNEPLPWDHIVCGREKLVLAHQWQDALSIATEDVVETTEFELEPERDPPTSLDLTVAAEPPAQVWWRLVYCREGAARFLSVLEVFAMWDKALRRAGLRLSFSQGFNPRPRITLGPALPVGVAGLDEIVDIAFPDEVPLTRAKDLTLPQGVKINEAFLLTKRPIPTDAKLDRESFLLKTIMDEPVGLTQINLLLDRLAHKDQIPAELIHWKQQTCGIEITIGRSISGQTPNLRRVLRSLGLVDNTLTYWEVTRTASLSLVNGSEIRLADIR